MQLPSPLQQVIFNGYQIWIKRDDLIDPFISGNKWRKLKYILEKAARAQKRHLITFGGAYSNHLLATAAAAAKLNFRATAFIRGEEVSNEVLMLCKLYGMKLLFVDRIVYKDKLTLFKEVFGNDPDAFFIDEGGASEEAVEGCAELIAELPLNFNHIFCAAGTGTTAAGLLRGVQNFDLSAKLHVVPVLKGGAFISDEIFRYQPNLNNLELHLDYHFGGYAKTTPALIDFIRQFVAATGILIDPIYTGKMMFAIFDLLERGMMEKEEKILAVHSGGLFGILGKKGAF